MYKLSQMLSIKMIGQSETAKAFDCVTIHLSNTIPAVSTF